jgi:uncharacterized protein YeaO (DUF488 family)
VGILAARVYELGGDEPGGRWLVDRVWPRGVSRSSLRLDGWARDAAPSDELRRWFGHDPGRWAEFRRRYLEELDAAPDGWGPLLDAARTSDVLLLYATRDHAHNNAVVLRDYLASKLAPPDVDDEVGDPVCWLNRVCPECGRFAEDPTSDTCRYCGSPLPS